MRDQAPVVYRASFDTDVQIFEGEKKVAAAERLEIDILQPPQEDPATKPAAAADESADASTRPSKRRRADATSAPTSMPAMQGPITVKWTGKLRVVPLEGERDPGLVAGKALVRLTGTPVEIDHQDMKVRSGVVAFNSADGSAWLRANDIVPIVTMTLGDGSAKVSTTSLTYAQQRDGKRIATLVGESRAEMTGKGAKDPLVLTWNKDGRIELIDLPTGKSAIERADFTGNVKIVHPDLDMTGQTLSLAFDPSRAIKSAATQTAAATTSPATGGSNDDVADSLREIIATGDVNCRMLDAGEERDIAAQKLVVQLDLAPTGERYARLIRADGGVRTKQGKDEMQAGQLIAELAPAAESTTKPVATVATVDASDAKHGEPVRRRRQSAARLARRERRRETDHRRWQQRRRGRAAGRKRQRPRAVRAQRHAGRDGHAGEDRHLRPGRPLRAAGADRGGDRRRRHEGDAAGRPEGIVRHRLGRRGGRQRRDEPDRRDETDRHQVDPGRRHDQHRHEQQAAGETRGEADNGADSADDRGRIDQTLASRQDELPRRQGDHVGDAVGRRRGASGDQE